MNKITKLKNIRWWTTHALIETERMTKHLERAMKDIDELLKEEQYESLKKELGK